MRVLALGAMSLLVACSFNAKAMEIQWKSAGVIYEARLEPSLLAVLCPEDMPEQAAAAARDFDDEALLLTDHKRLKIYRAARLITPEALAPGRQVECRLMPVFMRGLSGVHLAPSGRINVLYAVDVTLSRRLDLERKYSLRHFRQSGARAVSYDLEMGGGGFTAIEAAQSLSGEPGIVEAAPEWLEPLPPRDEKGFLRYEGEPKSRFIRNKE